MLRFIILRYVTDVQFCGFPFGYTIITAVTTGPVCKDNEVLDICITEYENCMADCAVFRKSSVCDNLDNATNCIEGCRCVEGFRR